MKSLTVPNLIASVQAWISSKRLSWHGLRVDVACIFLCTFTGMPQACIHGLCYIIHDCIQYMSIISCTCTLNRSSDINSVINYPS